MYSIIKAQQNLHNDMCDLLGLMRVFAVEWAYWGGRDEGSGYDEFGRWIGLGCGIGIGWVGCVWCWDSIGRAVDIPWQRYSAYPDPISTQHHAVPVYAPLATPHSHHLAQTHPHHTHHTHHPYPASIPHNSTPAQTLLKPTRPDPRPYPKPSVHCPIPDTPYPLPTRPTPTSQSNPSTPPYTLHILSYPPNLLPLYAQPAAKTRISPSKAHMSLGRFCFALTIEYKFKTSNINKRF